MWDTARQSRIEITGAGSKGASTFEYDANGHASKVVDNAVTGIGKKRVMTYVKNAQGQVLHREDFTEGGQLVRYRDFFFANSRQIGDLSNDGPSREDYVQAQASQKAREADKDSRNRQPVAAVDFDQNYEPISASYPGNAASFYTAQAGDSLRAIAQAVWGDGAMWYLIAEANGYDADVSLRGGEVIEIPNKVANIHHNASTVRVYNPGEALGNTQPTLPDPPPPPPQPPAGRGGCGGIAKIIMIAVAVVVTIYTAGAASAAIGSMMTAGSAGAMGTVGAGLAASSASMSFGALAVGGAVGAAAGSAASQLVGMALGEVDKFSWSAVGNAAIIGGISGGIGSLGAGGSVARALGASSWAATAISAGVNTTISQGLMSAAGAGNFSWRNVAASAIAAPITQSIGDSIFGTVNQATGAVTSSGAAWAQGNETAANLVNNFLGGSINQLARATVYGRSDSWRDAGLNVLGETLGNGLVGKNQRVYRQNADFVPVPVIAEQEDPRTAAAASSSTIDSDDGMVDLGNNRTRLRNGKIVRSSVPVGIPRVVEQADTREILHFTDAGQPVYGSGFGRVPEGLIRNTQYPMLGGTPSYWNRPDGGPLTYSFDSTGQAFWSNGENLLSIPIPYATPQLSDLQGTALLNGLGNGLAAAPSGLLDGISALAHGRVSLSLSDLADGFYQYSPIGVLGAMLDDRYDLAGGRIAGIGVGVATGYVAGRALPVVGAASSFALRNTADLLAPVAGPMLENHLYRMGGVMYAVPPGGVRRLGGYIANDVDAHGLLSPQSNRALGHTNTKADNYVQSHHPIQDKWARVNIVGYDSDVAPAILLESASGFPHAKISASQRALRVEMKNNGISSWINPISKEFNIGYKQMIDAGVSKDMAKKAIKDSYKYFDSLGAFK